MALSEKEYVGPSKQVLVLEPDPNESGPYLPLSQVTTIGAKLVAAASSSGARSAIGAAASGNNSDILQLLGMSTAESFTKVVTPKGTVSLSTLLAALGAWGGSSRTLTEDGTLLSSDGVLLYDTDTAACTLSVPVALGQNGEIKVSLVLKIGTGTNPLTITDDSDNFKTALYNGGSAMALVVISEGVVYAYGIG